MPANDVLITISDGALGNVVVPPSSVMAVVGCCSSGTPNQVLSTASKSALVAALGYGPLVEAAAMVIDAGGTVLACKAPTVTTGAVLLSPSTVPNITAVTNANPAVVTSTAHGLATGQVVTIAGVLGATGVNGTWPVTVLTANTFSVPVAAGGAWTSGGAITNTGLTFTGSGSSTAMITISGAPYDDYRLAVKIVAGGTVGTAGITFQLSLDAGRTYGPVFALGTALTYTIPQSGITLNWTTAQIATAGDLFTATTTAPLWNDAGVSAAINAIQASPYNWGAGIHVVGVSAGADATAIEGYLDTLATQYRYTFALLDVRDFKTADASESGWMTSILNDYSATSCVRVIAGAGWYNQPSSIVNQSVGGLPRYRRPLSWSAARRIVQVPPYVLLSRVSDGPLGGIVVNPSLDPSDGYIYHDERANGGLGPSNNQTGRFMAARTRIGYGANFFVDEPAMLAPAGSDYTLLPYRMVMDIGSSLTHQVLQQFINGNVRLNPNGTILEKDARALESVGSNTYKVNMTNVGMISSASFALSRTDNIATTKTVNATGRFVALGYILEIDVNLGYQSPFAVAGS